jgi:hypothetical protein
MTLKIVFWDVQHGSATYIRTPNGMHFVQDLGVGSYNKGDNEEFSPLENLKEKWKINQLDWVTITHPHKDHIDDIMKFDGLSPRLLTCPSHLSEDEIKKNIKDEDKHLFDKYFEILKRYSGESVGSIETTLPDNRGNPLNPEKNGGVKLFIFTPKLCSTNNINNHSIVTLLSYAGFKIILPGDNEPCAWNELLERDNFKRAITGVDILLAPHHGKDSGFYSYLFEYFEPKLTVLSDGPLKRETSAVSKYSKVSTGLTVRHRNDGDDETRYCVTTRNDGAITIEVMYNSSGRPFIDVTID